MAAFAFYSSSADYSTGTKRKLWFRRVMGADPSPGKEITLHYWGEGAGVRDIRSYADLQAVSEDGLFNPGIEGEHPCFHSKVTFKDTKIVDPPSIAESVVDLPYRFQTASLGGWAANDAEGVVWFNPAPSVYIHTTISVTYHWYPGDFRVIISQTGQRGELRPSKRYTGYYDWYTSPEVSVSYYDHTFYEWDLKKDELGRRMIYGLLPQELIWDTGDIMAQLMSQEITHLAWDNIPGDATFDPNDRMKPWQALMTAPVDQSLFDPYWDYVAFRDEHKQPAGLWTALTTEAISKTSFDSNSIANGLELFDLAMSIKNGRLISDIVKKGKIFETSKNAWLAYRYSYSTTLADIEELGEYIEDAMSTIVRSGDAVGDLGTAHFKMKLSPPQSEIKKCIDKLTSVGVAPNLYNLWDMVPYSFVADWFIGLGDILESITQYGRVNAYDINYVTTSWKWKHKYKRDGVAATLEFYERNVSSKAPAYTPYIEQPGPSGKTQVKRVLDSVALFS